MKGFKITTTLIILCLLALSVAACGGGNKEGDASGNNEYTFELTLPNEFAESTSTATETAAEQSSQTEEQQTSAAPMETPVEATAVETAPEVNDEYGVEKMLGEWKDVNVDGNFAIITKTDSGYQYQDNDGTYQAKLEGKVLKVQVSDTDTADVYLEENSNNLIVSFQGGLSEYTKK